MNKEAIKAVGPCPKCGGLAHWYNDVPLRAFCWGGEGKEHKEWSKEVPIPHNPYLKPYGPDKPRTKKKQSKPKKTKTKKGKSK